ncbi:GLIPR1-like protein 1 [Centruroides sculpturatus]|uniref:GLIPR1-like protein 1 n=1 Tax=Centruroides sculpturatus TaxID=218467 RepID=UPI000C6DFDFC|nr:GLIPR1-like protein 1 [Centruroides sculpturatus]XP_023217944.1 GLIPR1-like protein 1 [Centruroides sculpturatus]
MNGRHFVICLLYVTLNDKFSIYANDITFETDDYFEEYYDDYTADTFRAKETGTKTSFTEEEREDILDLSNLYRNSTNPTAADMLKLYWSDALAKLADRWSSQCKVYESGGPRDCFEFIGQNIYVGFKSYEAALNDWYDERHLYDYKNYSCAIKDKCNNYLNMVSAETHSVGCSIRDCSRTGYKYLIVCNYYPKFNSSKTKHPYSKGLSCESCVAKTICVNSLCELYKPQVPEDDLQTCSGFIQQSNIQTVFTLGLVIPMIFYRIPITE